MGSPVNTKGITDKPGLKRDRAEEASLPEEMDPLTHRAIFTAAKATQRTSPITRLWDVLMWIDSGGGLTWGRRILSPCGAAAYSQTPGHTHLWSAWGGRWPQCTFLSLKINSGWKCLLTPFLSVVPLLMSSTLGMSVPPLKHCPDASTNAECCPPPLCPPVPPPKVLRPQLHY